MRKLLRVLLVLWVLGSLPAGAVSAGAPPALRPDGIPDSYRLIAENPTFRLYLNPETLAFKVLDTRSGYIWHSNLDERAPGDRLNRTWTAFAQSGLSIDALDARANVKRASITLSEHTLEIHPVENGVQAQVAFPELGISVGMILQLEETGVRVEVPFETIREEGEYRLHLLHLYPWMGATRGDEIPGYMFIPDGCGALIRFTAQTKATNMYYGRYYGADLGIQGVLPFNPHLRRPYPISVPVIGMVHGEGQNAYILIIEKGASYAEIQAHPAGIITNFNFLYNAFIYNESYFQPTSRAGDGVTAVQPRTNRYDIVIHYRFLTGPEAHYVGMARSYQQYLLEKGILRPQHSENSPIGIRLEFLGAEWEQVLFWHRPIPMTTLEQMETVLSTLNVANPQVVYYGWQPGGASAPLPVQGKLDPALGRRSELVAMAERVKARGGTFSLYYDPLSALRGGAGDVSRYDLALAINSQYIRGYHRNHPVHYLSPSAAEKRLLSLGRDVQKWGVGLAVNVLGSVLYSDFRRSHSLNREETIAAYQRMLTQSPVPIAFYGPNDYLFAYATAYYDIPLTSNGYVYVSEDVPFLPIVLSGYLPYYGEALNFSPDVRGDLLRHAEFGAYPSFFVTYEDTARILNTRSNWIYVSSYRQLKDEIEESYAWLDALLSPVRGATITGHRTIADGVVATTYSNGRQIVVNYRDQPVEVGGLVIPARDAVLREVGP